MELKSPQTRTGRAAPRLLKEGEDQERQKEIGRRERCREEKRRG
jgi:hypothetical protein